MPIIESTYNPPWLFKNGHINTIISNQMRNIEGVNYDRQRFETPDGDFFDVDFSKKGSKTLALVLHGLEGNSERPYARGMVRQANNQGWDACVLNQRGCSGEANRLLTSYHSGWTTDLRFLINHFLKENYYETIFLIGISIGGNMTLKYLGEERTSVSPKIKAAVAVSAPVDLYSSVEQLAKKSTWVYMRRFLKTLKAKSKVKLAEHPECGIDLEALMHSKSFKDFDHQFTAPINGFESGMDYWTKNSSRPFIPLIQIPTLLITSLDDPFLGKKCYPIAEAKSSEFFHLMLTKYGGHVGFSSSMNIHFPTFSEEEAFNFLQKARKS